MKRKSTLVDSVSAEPEVSAVGRKQLSSVVIPQNKANRLRNVSSEPVYAAPLARRSQSPARRSQSPTRRRATFNFSLLTAFAVLLCLFFGGKAWGQTTLWSENFEGGSMPSGWTTDGNGSWSVATAVNSTHPSSAGEGTYCAQIKHGSTGNATKLITPTIDLSSVTSAELSFMHAEQSWGGDIDGLKVYYRTSTSGTWTQLVEYTSAYASWTTETEIILPNLSSTYQLAFEYIDNYGYGLGIDDIRIVQGASCPKPTALSVTSTTTTSATLSWTPGGSETVWQYSINDGSWTNLAGVTGTTTKTATITGLTASTAYTVKIRANCGGGDFSDPTGNVSFATACTALTISALPYMQGFESETCPANCWTLVYGDGTGTANPMIHDDSYHNSGSRSFRFSSYNRGSDYNQYLISPEIDVASALDVTFHYANYGSSDNLYFGYSTTDASISSFTWTEVLENSGSQSNWLEYEQGLPAGTRYIAFHYYGDYAYYVNLDDVTIGLLSSCLKPTALAFVSATTTTATISWTPGGSETAWQYSINDGSWTNLAGVTGTTTKTATITELTAGTAYTVKIRANCGGGDFSNPTANVSFTTSLCDPANMCEISYELGDSSNDGWDDNAAINVVDVATSEVIAIIRLASGGSGSGTLSVCNGRNLSFVWINGGTYDYECSYTIKDVNGDDIFSGSGTLSTVNYTVNCGSCPKPTGLTASNITGSSATISWEGNADSYNVRWTEYATVTLTVDGDVWGDGSGYQILLDSNADAYDVYVPAGDGVSDDIYNEYEYKIPVNADGDIYTSNIVFDNSITIQVPAGTYDWYITNPSPDYGSIYIAASNGNVGGRADDYIFEAGKHYEFVVSNYGGVGNDDQTNVYVSTADTFEHLVEGIEGNTYSITGLNASTTYFAQVQSDCGSEGTSGWTGTTFTTPFQIATVEQWNQFCGYVNNCTRDFYGETVFLAANIGPVSTMAGTSSCPFRGTFEGQGYKINVGISSSEQGAAPFRYISGATIQNLKVDGTVTSTAHHASGLVGFCADGSTNTIQNCHISTNVSNSNAYAGDGGSNYMGGIVGHNKGATTSIIGCVYDGTLTSQGFKGGMIGFADPPYPYTATVYITITDSYFAGSYSANGYGDPNFSPVAVRAGHGFIFDLTSSNFYYNTDAGDFTATQYSFESNSNKDIHGTCKHAYTVTGESPVTVAMNGTPTPYNVSGITAYSTGIEYDGTIYGGSGDNLSLSLGYTCSLSGYSADNGTLSGSATTGTNDAYTLTMAASNTTINASVAITVTANPSDGGTVSAGGTYQAGSSCTVTATANTGYTFSNWEKSGSEVSTSSSYTFNVSCAGELVANFTPNTYQVTLHTDGGTINAGNVTSYTYGVGATLPSNVTKTGYTFAGWYDNSGLSGSAVTSISTTDYGDKEYWAKWIVNSYTVTTIVYPSAGGTATGEGSYNYGTTATISATANTGYQFVNWTGSDGSVVSHNASYSFTVTGDVTYQANFTSTTPLSLPWSANFDNYSGPTPQLLPGEWATPLRNEQKPCVHYYDYAAASDHWCLEMRGSDASMVVLPQFDRPLNKLTVSFKCARGTTTGPAKLGYVTDPSDAGSFVELATMSTPVYLSGSNPQPTSYSFDLTTIANAPDNSNYRLAILATNIAESFYFDDFWVIEFSAESASVDNSYCIDEVATTLSVNVSGSGSYSYQWYKDGSSISGETGSSYTPLTETDGTATYTVSVTDRNCGNTANVTIAQITINTPSPDVSGTYDYIWRGLSADWNTASNWYMYSEGNYTVASTMPTEAKDYYIGTGSSCIEPSYWPSFIDDVEVNNITIASGSNDITIGEGKTLTIDGAATFSGGIIKGNVEFGASGSTTGASLTSYVDGIVTKNGNGSSFTFPTGSDGVLGTITATITSGESAVAKFNHKSSGFDQEHDGYPRWWNVADMCGAEPFNHVSNFEYWDFNSTADLSGVTFVSKASSADAHFHNPSEYPADDSDIIQIAVYDGCWKNIGGHLEMSDENKTITISGVNASRGTTRSGSAITTFGSKDPSVVLPIELTSFTATCDGRSTLVEWTTATEKNNDYFSLERSDDAMNFTEIARVAGAGNSIEPIDYAYNDYGIHGGDNYYRLVQVDYDGTRTVSEVIVANCIEPESDGEPEVLAYPNPFSSELTVVLDNFGNRAATIEVYDMLGKLIYTNKVAAPQNSYETILNLSNLPPAAYTVRVSTNDFVINRNVVKN